MIIKLVKGSVMYSRILISLALFPTSPWAALTEINSRNPEAISMGSNTITAHQLNMSCTVAPEKANLTKNTCLRFQIFYVNVKSFPSDLNDSLSAIWVKDTMVLVTEVPMLDPMTMGTAVVTVSAPAPTMATTMEVKVELLWTSTVPRMPISNLVC